MGDNNNDHVTVDIETTKQNNKPTEQGDKIKPKEQDDNIKPKEQDNKIENEAIDKPYIGKPHNGRPINKIEFSPNGKYLVTYSAKDFSFVGWNVEDIDEGRLEPDIEERSEQEKNVTIKTVKTVKTGGDGGHQRLNQICVADDKKFVYIYSYTDLNDK